MVGSKAGPIQGATTSSNWLVWGYVVTGLNCYTGSCGAMGKNQLYRDNPLGTIHRVQWSNCLATTGIQAMAAMRPQKNTFIDNWAAY